MPLGRTGRQGEEGAGVGSYSSPAALTAAARGAKAMGGLRLVGA